VNAHRVSRRGRGLHAARRPARRHIRKRRLLVITLLALAAGSIVAALSANLWIVVAGRVVQGIGGGIRSVGSSLGSQVSATILASSAVAGIPTDSGYTRAFAVSAVVAAGAGVAAVFIPRAPGHQHAPPLNELGAASPLGEPAYARDEG